MRAGRPERYDERLALVLGGSLCLGLLCLAGCASAESVVQESVAITAEARLEIVETVFTAPVGGDGADRRRYAFVDADGTRTLLDDEAIAGVVWRGEPVLLDHRQRLFVAGSSRLELARAVPGPPAVDRSGQQLAYTTVRDGLGEVVLQDGAAPRTIARGLGGAGALVFSPDGSAVLFVGARNGGVAGLHVADTSGSRAARCLSSCELRTGRPWGQSYVVPPAGAAALHFDGDEVSWDGGDGRTERRSWR